MTRGPEIPLWKRHSAITYRVQENLSFGQIASRLNISKEALKAFIRRAKSRARSLSIEDLQEAVAVQPRPGRDKRAEPSEPLSHEVRRGVQMYEEHAPHLAANHHLQQRQILGEIDSNIRPIARQQVHNILHDEEHCKGDPEEQRALTRKRKINRNALSDHNITERLQYCTIIESLSLTSTLIICVDEKGYDFGGTANQHVTTPRGASQYHRIAPVRFRIEQWAASCGDNCSITRP